MNLEHLSTFVCIVELGSLSAAARARRISQPAVTKQVQRLEAELGLALLVRGSRRRVQLTPAGERLLSFARKTLELLDVLEQDLATLKTTGRGTLSLAASTIPGEYVLPALLAGFRAKYPAIEVTMIISDTANVAAKILADEVGVGVVGYAIKRPGLRLERLLGDEIILAVPSQHPFAQREYVTVEELRGQPLILREEGSGTRQTVESILETAGSSLPQDGIALVLGSTQAVLQAVTQGLGLGFVSARAAAQAQADGHVSCVRLAGVDLHRDLYVAYLSQRLGDPLVARFLDFARSQYDE